MTNQTPKKEEITKGDALFISLLAQEMKEKVYDVRFKLIRYNKEANMFMVEETARQIFEDLTKEGYFETKKKWLGAEK